MIIRIVAIIIAFILIPYSSQSGVINTCIDTHATNIRADLEAAKPVVRVFDTVYVQLNSNDLITIIPSQIDNGSTADVGIDTMFVTPNTFDCTTIGFNPVVLTVIDSNGIASTGRSIVYVNSYFKLAYPTDTLDECAPITIQWSGGCSGWNVDVTLIKISPFVNQAIAATNIANSGTLDWQIPPTVPEGLYQFYIQQAGTSPLNWQYGPVLYIRNTPPTVITQNISVQLDAQGKSSITASQINNGSRDICGIASMSVTPDTFDCSSVGDVIVVLRVTDINGNTSSAAATVTVIDSLRPIISPPPDLTVNVDAGSSVATNVLLGTPTTTDNCGIASTTNNAPASYPIGITIVTWTTTDIHGNSSTAVQAVTVLDNTKRVLMVSLPVAQANLDEIVTIPLTVDSMENVANSTFMAFIRFNKTLLLPMNNLPVTFSADDAILTVTGNFLQTSKTLATLQFKVMMGNADRTPLRIDSFRLENQDKVQIVKKNGELQIKDLCQAGDSTRLFRRVLAAALVTVRPNPIATSAEIEFILSESGKTTLSLTDLSGHPIAVIWEANAVKGNYTTRLNSESLSIGEYFLQLCTPSEVFTTKLIISK